jgi:hypothetical protein
MTKRQIKKTCLLFGEGAKELIFFHFLERTKKFENLYYKDWVITPDHASGCSCRNVLEKCIKTISDASFDLILCFIDLDKLSDDFRNPKDCEKEKKDLEQLAKKFNINIIWQDKNHEDELKRATKGKIKGKAHMKKRLFKNEDLVVKSDFVKKILNYLK